MNGFAGRLVPRTGLLTAEFANSPPPFEHRDCQVLFWGHIANRAELGRRLGLAGVDSEPDALLIAEAYRAWQNGLPAQVLGEFAAVVHDRRAGRALLTHDSLGLAPLYHAERAGGVAFATHLVDLLDTATTASLDQEYLADFLAQGFVATERTPFTGIKRLLPGRSLAWSGGNLRETAHWALADTPDLRCRGDEEYESRFRDLLAAAVQGGVGVSGKVWAELSGGLDSSSIASMAATLGVPGLAVYSVYCPSFARADERRWMREVVERYGLPWHLLNLETALPFSRPPGEFLGEPTPAVISEARAQADEDLFASHGVEAVLSGFGGDAVLGAFQGPIPVHLADGLFQGHPLAALRAAAEWRRESNERRSRSYWLMRCLLEPSIRHWRGRAIASAPPLPLQAWIEPGYARRMQLSERRRHRLAPRCRSPGRQQLADSLWVAALQWATARQRRRRHRVHSPLMYRPLVEFMAAVPWEQKLRPKCDRFLQRRALRGILPEAIRRRAGKGVGSPPLIEGLARAPDWVDSLTEASRLAACGIADPGRWRLAVRQAALGQTHGDQFFLAGVAVEVWLRQLEDYRRSRPK